MRVLFVPFPTAPISHVLPLLALDKMLYDTDIETAFLLPKGGHAIISQVTDCVLDIDHEGFRTEMAAYAKFSPDIVVDDASTTTRYATQLARIPRIAIQRTGMFPGTKPRHAHHHHSMGITVDQLPDVSFMGLKQPTTFEELFEAPFKIVPGIPTIEVLPPTVPDPESYIFAGPLLMDDYMIDYAGFFETASQNLGPVEFQSFNPLLSFFAAHQDRRKVYLTFGSVAKAMPIIFECIRYLLDQGIVVVTSIKLDHLTPQQQELYYHATYLPLHLVCANVDLAIHHCGSATYHYPILHTLPALTIGTQCYDRDDVAARLAELGASEHLPSPAECEDFTERFKQAIQRFFDDSNQIRQQRTQVVQHLKQQIHNTSAQFDFEQLLYAVMQ